MNKEYLKRLFNANWTLEEVEDFKAQVIADHEEKIKKMQQRIDTLKSIIKIQDKIIDPKPILGDDEF